MNETVYFHLLYFTLGTSTSSGEVEVSKRKKNLHQERNAKNCWSILVHSKHKAHMVIFHPDINVLCLTLLQRYWNSYCNVSCVIRRKMFGSLNEYYNSSSFNPQQQTSSLTYSYVVCHVVPFLPIWITTQNVISLSRSRWYQRRASSLRIRICRMFRCPFQRNLSESWSARSLSTSLRPQFIKSNSCTGW